METTRCPHCKAEIEPDARKCRYCREWVNWRYPLRRSAALIVLVVVVWAGFALSVPGIMERGMFQAAKFWEQPESLQITEHHSAEQGEYRVVIGTVKNVSAIPWKSITVQADYYDKQSRVVDSGKQALWEALAPGQERVFKVSVGKQGAGADYDHYRVYVAGADDASRF